LIILLSVAEAGVAQTDLAAMMPVALVEEREDSAPELGFQLLLERHTQLLLVVPALVRLAQPLVEEAGVLQYFLPFHLRVVVALVLMLQMEFLGVLAVPRELMDREQKLVVLEIHRLLHLRKGITAAPELEIAADQEVEGPSKLGLPEVALRLGMEGTALRQEQV
jgi:hypothetical protein